MTTQPQPKQPQGRQNGTPQPLAAPLLPRAAFSGDRGLPGDRPALLSLSLAVEELARWAVEAARFDPDGWTTA